MISHIINILHEISTRRPALEAHSPYSQKHSTLNDIPRHKHIARNLYSRTGLRGSQPILSKNIAHKMISNVINILHDISTRGPALEAHGPYSQKHSTLNDILHKTQ